MLQHAAICELLLLAERTLCFIACFLDAGVADSFVTASLRVNSFLSDSSEKMHSIKQHGHVSLIGRHAGSHLGSHRSRSSADGHVRWSWFVGQSEGGK